ncbi:MAG: DNA polymerase III subunit chi [Betaproteobacteria bacterium]|nr:DNA polymerase III subunit chi [Betaproteobacteria bacterium]MBV9360989.1 DNA polymerase III subunit chi [Betaproteobacteria bacterium]
MTSIDFYFNAADRLQVACRLAAKALAERKRVLIYTPDAELASKLDRLMWTWPATGFVPHCASHDALASETPVLIGGDDEAADIPILLNLSADCPPHFASFERLLEVVGAEEADREPARARFRMYKSRGYAIASHDLARDNG